ncbi:MAG: (d)CMP kinase [Clostridia bacterium]|nr:(d)CMP kinase [Clostridia bacterium]
MINIAIDGPSGAGKSTIAKIIAKKLNIIYLDTGAMYRAVAWKAISLNIEPNDSERVKMFLDALIIDIKYIDGVQYIFADGIDVTNAIREHHMSKAASDISKIPEVRLKLVDMQRDIASKNDVVLDGRDITSYVLPNAKYKFYLTAKAEERASRRVKELAEKGQHIEYEKMLADIIDRDYNDSTRAFAPLTKTIDSVEIDSTAMGIEEVANIILSYIEEA